MKSKQFFFISLLFLALIVIPAVTAETTYTPSTRTTCEGLVCTQTIFSGTEYVEEDGQWKHYTEAKSLKDVEGFEIKFLEIDKDYNLEIVDFNATSVTVNLNPDGLSIFSKDVPVKLWNTKDENSTQLDFKNTYEKRKEEQLSFHLLNQEETKTYNFGFGDILEFGPNSTTFILDFNYVEDDTYIDQDNPTTINGASTLLYLEEYDSDDRFILIKFNTTGIPDGAMIENATLSLYLSSESLVNQDVTSYLHHVYNSFSWNEETMNWNGRPTSGTEYNATVEYTRLFEDGVSTTTGIFYNWTAKSSVQTSHSAGYNNVTLYIRADATVTSQDDNLRFVSKESGTSAQRPLLYITYINPVIEITHPLPQNYISVDRFNWTIDNYEMIDTCWYSLDSASNTSVTCSDNSSLISPSFGSHDLEFWVNDSRGIETKDSVSFTISGFEENSITYDSTSFETQTDTYVLNITSDGVETVTAVMYYNGTTPTVTKTGDNTEMEFSSTITHPINDVGNKSFYWNVSYGGAETSTTTSWQDVQNFTLNLCNGTNGETYVNFTFVDEESTSYINSTFEIDGTGWQYYLGDDDTVYKNLQFNNQTENSNYAFCLYNANETMHSNSVSFRYSASGYPERIHTRADDLSNDTTDQILYLLGTGDGIYSSIQVQDVNSVGVQGATVQVERQFSGTWVIIALDTTDSSGLVTFFVNPNQNHRYTVTKTGYSSTQVTIRPTQSVYTIVLSGPTTNTVYNFEGIRYDTSPSPGLLDPNTNYIFEFNVTDSTESLTGCKVEIRDVDFNVVDSNTGCNASGGDISVTINTSSYSKLFGNYYINRGSGYVLLKSNDAWLIEFANFTGAGGAVASVVQAMQDFVDWEEFGDTHNRREFSRITAFFILLTIVLGLFSYYTGFEMSNPGGMLLLLWGIMAIASYGGLFAIEGIMKNAWLSKYVLLLCVSFITFGYLINQWRRSNFN